MKNTATTVKLSIFTLVMVLIFAGLVVVFSQATFSATNSYHAVFTNASGLSSGDKVRIAGVPVGSVTSAEVGRDNLAHVELDVDEKYQNQLLESTRATIRYENLVGDRYLELLEGAGSFKRLSVGGTIPKSQTAPALDLDLLLGGFKPLLKGLDPEQVNELSGALVDIFQGQGDTLVSLLGRTGSLTKTLADRDQLIGSVVGNLNEVLETIDAKGDQFSSTLDRLQLLVSGLARDREPIADAIPKIADATGSLADLMEQSRPDLKAVVDQTGRLTTNLDAGSEKINWVLEHLPESYLRLIRLGAYGSFFQFYACGGTLRFTGPDDNIIKLNMLSESNSGRCARS